VSSVGGWNDGGRGREKWQKPRVGAGFLPTLDPISFMIRP